MNATLSSTRHTDTSPSGDGSCFAALQRCRHPPTAGSELDHSTAVDHERLASAPLGFLAHEVLHGRIEVGRLPEALDDVVGLGRMNRVLAALVLARRGAVHEARCHAVDGDAVRAELTRKVPGDLV